MTALVQVLSSRSMTHREREAIKAVAMFFAAGLFVSLLFATYGLDLSPGFF